MPTSGSYPPVRPGPGAVEGLIPSADDSFCFFTGPLLPPDDVTFSSSLEIVSAKLFTLALVLENFLRGNSFFVDNSTNGCFPAEISALLADSVPTSGLALDPIAVVFASTFVDFDRCFEDLLNLDLVSAGGRVSSSTSHGGSAESVGSVELSSGEISRKSGLADVVGALVGIFGLVALQTVRLIFLLEMKTSQLILSLAKSLHSLLTEL